MKRHNEAGNVILGTIALLLALGAFVLAWLAYDRTGGDLDSRIQQQVQESVNTGQNAAEEAGQNLQEAADQTEQNLDEGPDGVDDGSQ